ncbi:protease modulator HflC [soil metagenome]
MTPTKSLNLVLLLVIVVLIFTSLYTVREGQKALITHLGSLKQDRATGKVAVKLPGLHFKIPLIEQARIFDTRLQTADIQSSRIVTAEKKDVIVDYYVKWRISNLPLYFTRTGGSERQTEILLAQQLNDALRAEFGRRTIGEVVADDRSKIMEELLKQTNQNSQQLGLDIVDVRIKRIDLPTEVSAAVFERMRAERERVATEHRSEGKSKAEIVRATADADVTITIATAKASAAAIRASGDAEAGKIYANAYNQDAAFYAFYRSLEAYQHIFDNKKDIIVLKPDSQFFRYFNSAQGMAKK